MPRNEVIEVLRSIALNETAIEVDEARRRIVREIFREFRVLYAEQDVAFAAWEEEAAATDYPDVNSMNEQLEAFAQRKAVLDARLEEAWAIETPDIPVTDEQDERTSQRIENE